MTYIMSNLPEEYVNIIENLKEKLDEDINIFNIKIIMEIYWKSNI